MIHDGQPWPNWWGETVIVVATGPSAEYVPLRLAQGRARVLAIKDGWQLAPWADALYCCDHRWWAAHDVTFAGQRIVYDKLDQAPGRLTIDIRRGAECLLFDRIGEVGWGYNTGFHAVNLALQFGAARLLLVGFDFRGDLGIHFFGEHPYLPSDRDFPLWTRLLDEQAPVIAERGVSVVNCSPVSALTAYPKMSLEEALA